MEHYSQFLIDLAFPIINFVILTLVGLVLSFLTKFIHGKDKKQKAKMAMKSLDSSILMVVKSLEAQLRPKLSDGKLSKAEAREIKNMAIEEVNQIISPSLAKFIDPFVQDISSYISNKVEDFVLDIKTHKNDEGGK